MSPFFYTILSLVFTNIALAVIFFTAYFKMGRERHTLIWAFTFLIGATQWLVNIFKPSDQVVYWMLACSLSVGTIVFGTWGHFIRTSVNYSRKVLFGSGIVVILITYYFTAVEPHLGLSQSLYIFHTVFYLCICAYVLVRYSKSSKTAEIGAAVIYFLFAIAQGVAATAALMQGAESDPAYFDLYRTINFVSLPTGYIGMSLFIVFILASDMSQKADRANHEKSRFLAAASHDLRQPLNSMGLFIFALKQKVIANAEDVPIVLARVESAHKELSELFEGILELSRLDSGSIVVDYKDIRLDKLMSPIISELKQQATAKNLDFEYSGCEAYLKTDPILLSRILRNLIGNAIKYTVNGKIRVYVHDKGGELTFDVIDTGVGIPKSEFKAIFSEYHQIANQRRNRKDGVGLGLSIVKKMCDLLGYYISVESEVGKGSRFTLTINDAVLGEQAMHKDNLTTPDGHICLDMDVLIIDDEQDILDSMSLILREWGCNVYCARNYQEANEKILTTNPNVILSDFRLQDDMNGLEVIAALQEKIGKDIPAVLITADVSKDILIKAEQQKIKVISKPVSPSKLENFLLQIQEG
jgi:signal transduction histidine kinase